MEEKILVIGNIDEEAVHNNAVLLKTLIPDYNILAVNPQQGISLVKQQDVVCMAVIINLPAEQHSHALHTIIALQNVDMQLPIIMWVQYGEESFAKDALKAGAYDFITRPISSEKLVLSLKHACDVRRMRGYIARLEQHIVDQGDISEHERNAIMMTQMNRLLVDESGELKPLKSMEKDIIVAALGYTGGCVSRAARGLGIGRSTLYRKVSEYNIQDYMNRDNQMTRPAMPMRANARFSGE